MKKKLIISLASVAILSGSFLVFQNFTHLITTAPVEVPKVPAIIEQCVQTVIVNDLIFPNLDNTLSSACPDRYAKSFTVTCANLGAKKTYQFPTCQPYASIRKLGATFCSEWKEDPTNPESANGCVQSPRLEYTVYAGKMKAADSSAPSTASDTVLLQAYDLSFEHTRFESVCKRPDIKTSPKFVTVIDTNTRTKLFQLGAEEKNLKIKIRCPGPEFVKHILSGDPAIPDVPVYVKTRQIELPPRCNIAAVEELPAPTKCRFPLKKGLGISAGNFPDSSKSIELMEKLNIGWYYSWSIDGFAPTPNIKFIPLVFKNEFQRYPQELETLIAAINAKTIPVPDTLLGYNEPENEPQANLSVELGVEFWPQVMQLKKSLWAGITNKPNYIKLASPAIGFDDSDSSWLAEFADSKLPNSEVLVKDTLDFVVVHWHRSSTNPRTFIDKMTELYNYYKKPIWITELSPGDFKHEDGRKPGVNCDKADLCMKEFEQNKTACAGAAECLLQAEATKTTCYSRSSICSLEYQRKISKCNQSQKCVLEAKALKANCLLTYDEKPNQFTVARIKEFMRVVIPWMEATPWIHRYAWYSQYRMDPRSCTSRLYETDGTLTELGREFAKY